MEWIIENWLWILLFGLFIGMHFFGHGHGSHGGCGGHGSGHGSEGHLPDEHQADGSEKSMPHHHNH